MRIAKVALAFFSIGFLAGSFERAAGLGHSDLSRGPLDRQVGAAVARGTLTLMTFTALGDLPDELVARPLLPQHDLPETVSAGLSELMADQLTPVLYAPAVPAELAVPDPQLHSDVTQRLGRWRFGVRRALSEPDLRPFSKLPPPMSLPSFEPWLAAPNAGSERDVQSAGGPEFIMPFERGRVTSLFNQGRYHPAIDLAGPLGSRVQATTRRQRVIFTGWRNGYGNTVVTRDEAGRMHLYGHLQRIVARVGIVLEQGLMLGTLGSTGRSTGPHVHYEVKTRAGAHVDPVTLLFGRRVGRGYAWNGSRSVTRVAARTDRQPRPR